MSVCFSANHVDMPSNYVELFRHRLCDIFLTSTAFSVFFFIRPIVYRKLFPISLHSALSHSGKIPLKFVDTDRRSDQQRNRTVDLLTVRQRPTSQRNFTRIRQQLLKLSSKFADFPPPPRYDKNSGIRIVIRIDQH